MIRSLASNRSIMRRLATLARISAAAGWFVLATVVGQIGYGNAHASGINRLSCVTQTNSRDQKTLCSRCLPTETIRFAGLHPAIEERLPLANFEPGQIVEINPGTMSYSEGRDYIASLKGLGARVSIYLVGGHCEVGADCDSLPSTVQIGSTGSWNWNEGERRILNITHPAVLARLATGIENGWRLGANYIRIDNLHHPAGSTHPRTAAQMQIIINLGQDIEDRLRADGSIEPERVTGLVAHNNLVSWRRLIEQGQLRRPPALLTSERTAQLAAFAGFEGDAQMKRGQLSPRQIPDIQAGRTLAEHFQIPYTIVEFRRSHDLAHPGQTYELPQTYVDIVRKLSGVTEVIVMPHESQYVGREQAFWGRGPKTLAKRPDLIVGSFGSRACLFKAVPR
jgi:hypothetical protein